MKLFNVNSGSNIIINLTTSVVAVKQLLTMCPTSTLLAVLEWKTKVIHAFLENIRA